MFGHHVILDIRLDDLDDLTPFASLDPPLQSLQRIWILLNAVNLNLLACALAGAHQFCKDQAFARAHIVADNDPIFFERV